MSKFIDQSQVVSFSANANGFSLIYSAQACVSTLTNTDTGAVSYTGVGAGNCADLLTFSTRSSGNSLNSPTVTQSTGVNTTTGLITASGTLPNWGASTYTQVQVASGGSLPTGLSGSTTYWAVPVSNASGTFYLASTLAHAQGGTYIVPSAAGSGTMTVTPNSAAGTLELFGSADGTNYVEIGSDSASLTGTAATTVWNVQPVYFRYYKLSLTSVTGGNFTISTVVNAISNTNQ